MTVRLSGATLSVDPDFAEGLFSAIRDRSGPRDYDEGLRPRPRYRDERHAPTSWNAGAIIAAAVGAALVLFVLLGGIIALNSGQFKTTQQAVNDVVAANRADDLANKTLNNEQILAIKRIDSDADVAKEQIKANVAMKQSDTQARTAEANANATAANKLTDAMVSMNAANNNAAVGVAHEQGQAISMAEAARAWGEANRKPLIVSTTTMTNVQAQPRCGNCASFTPGAQFIPAQQIAQPYPVGVPAGHGRQFLGYAVTPHINPCANPYVGGHARC